MIADKKAKKEYPPPIEDEILENILKKNKCSICGTSLDEESKRVVEHLYKFVTSVGDDSKKLKDMEDNLKSFKITALRIKSDLYKITNLIEEYKEDIGNLEKRINLIDQKLEGHEEEDAKNWLRELKSFEEILGKNQRKLGRLESKEETLTNNCKKWEKELTIRMNKREQLKEINIQKDFCSKALLSVVSNGKKA